MTALPPEVEAKIEEIGYTSRDDMASVAEQFHREHLLVEQRFNLRFRDGGDVVKMLLSQLFDLGSLDHAAIPDKGYAFAAKALDDFPNLGADGFGVTGVADEHLNG